MDRRKLAQLLAMVILRLFESSLATAHPKERYSEMVLQVKSGPVANRRDGQVQMAGLLDSGLDMEIKALTVDGRGGLAATGDV